ncbi:MAG: hypothetical protein CFE21_00785 [Bacteroidetes bacterium B1(2017)]|nr:MAG: hypothetical protein CFE21_00785 [Bacteroidetes bacterium B1(2017)]
MVRKFSVLLIFYFISSYTYSQTLITEGKLFYDITYKNLGPEMKRNEHMLPHEASFYFKNNKTRMEMGLGGIGKNSTIYDREKKTSTILLNISGKKFALVKSDSEMVEIKKSMNLDTVQKTIKIDYSNETKIIAGKTCKKAIINKTSKGITQSSDCWYTTEIPPFNTENDALLNEIKGFLMEYSITENGMTMVMKVKMVNPIPIEDKLFEIPPSYQLVTEKELNRLMMVLQNNPTGN